MLGICMDRKLQILNIVVSAIVLLASLIWPDMAMADNDIFALTEPSADISMIFTVSGRVEQIPVKEGQAVDKGDILIKLNAAAMEHRHSQLTLEAENQAEVLAAEAELKQKRQDLIKLEHAFSKGAATKIELEHAHLDVEISEYRLESAKHEKAVAALKKEEVAAELKEYSLLSPIKGLVERVELEVGETANTSEVAVRVVALDPLRIEANAPLVHFADLSPGQSVPLIFPDGNERPGTVVFRGAVADSASGTVRVSLEMVNPENRHAGERVILNIRQEEQ